MNIYYYIQPRQSGKTTSLFSEFFRKPQQNLFICHNGHMANLIRKSENLFHNTYNPTAFKSHITSVQKVLNGTSIRGKRFKTILMDEYDIWNDDHKANILNVLEPVLEDDPQIIIKTTQKKLYYAELIEIVKLYKTNCTPLNEIKRIAKKMVDSLPDLIIDQEVEELYNSLLTHRFTRVIVFKNHNSNQDIDR